MLLIPSVLNVSAFIILFDDLAKDAKTNKLIVTNINKNNGDIYILDQ